MNAAMALSQAAGREATTVPPGSTRAVGKGERTRWNFAPSPGAQFHLVRYPCPLEIAATAGGGHMRWSHAVRAFKCWEICSWC